ncbi:hypothetical protein [Pectobacterium aroidearum]|uniref:hypothetical protein n=1 Tax=Pectobacterium aroidearum TaxID=1201031 RepID=UPI002113EFE7|nr:hypothetical protein [Pectobacterium aroidearum]UUE46136.1 hypothetical protein L0Y28_05695 [Pectobacterium aroidearum]UUE50356.1 hypothetical protein L0Y23_05705 [Pectobacterium aroidearum]UUE54561.1 hypothetical protein L0Y30_05705 [Pectobacterium aroidearum]UUE62970.1 hypothetical protein L0Y29_05695 [Pectobacterium aroidearum]UUE67193.1 hypothetical protein L0Y22_05695 [Pectobacterium aroidearum]
MKNALLYAGLLMVACTTAYAGNQGGQINAQLTILPACGVTPQSGQYQMTCNVASAPQPKITESRIQIDQAKLSASAAKTTQSPETPLITVEW